MVLLGGVGLWVLQGESPSADARPSRQAASGSSTSSAPTGAGSPTARVTGKATPAKRLGSLVEPEPPTSARLPSGRVVPVRPVSTRGDGRLDVPENIVSAGWWRGGSKIGDPFGSLLVAAHIDSSTQGLGPFVELLSVRPGQRVRVTTRHLHQDFTIRSRRLVPQGSLAHQRWMFAPTGDPRLTLVTCAPPYIRSRGGYQNLAVVTAVPVTGARRGTP